MSSQGPSTGSAPAGVPAGYTWNLASIRDSSDWIKYKKQTAIYASTQINQSRDPWFVRGQDYRLEWLNGENKCSGCGAGAFRGQVDFNN